MQSVDTTESELVLPTVIRELTDADSDGYTVDSTPLNLFDKDKKWLELKDAFNFDFIEVKYNAYTKRNTVI